MSQHIAIITVVYKNYTVLREFISDLEKQREQNFHLFIADASPHPEDIETHQLACTIIPIKNKGYAHGVNKGIKKAQEMGLTKYCVINDDVSVKDTFTTTLDKAFNEHPKTAFGGKIYYAKGYEYHDRYEESEQGNILWYAGGTVDWKHAWTKHRGVDEVDHAQLNEVQETEFVTGCFFCFDEEVLTQVGLWDESYFLYYEDADYSERVKRADIPLLYNPDLTIWHKNGQSTDGSGSVLHEKLQRKSHLRFALKYAPIKTKLHVLKNYLIGR